MATIPNHIELGFQIEPKHERRALFEQIHGDEIVEIQRPGASPTPSADGAYSTQGDLTLYVFTADCLPLLFFTDQKEGPFGVVHSGWRGAQLGIASKMLKKLGTDIHVWLGPCILPCCYEIKSDFVDAFEKAGKEISLYLRKQTNKMFFDLPGFVLNTQLKTVHPSHLHLENLRCTYCSSPTLPSFRRNKSTDPQICSWIRKKTTR